MKNIVIQNKHDNREINIVYWDKGSKKRTVILFHGLMGNKFEYLDYYKNLGNDLHEADFNVVTYDMRCHGLSASDHNEFLLSNLVSDGIDVLSWAKDFFEIDQVEFFGASFGGGISIALAHMKPGEVSKVTLLAPVLDFGDLYLNPENKIRLRKYADLKERTLENGQLFEIDERRQFSRNMVIEFSLISLKDLIKRTPLKFKIFHGTKDGTIPLELTQKAVKGLENTDLTVVDGMEHGFTEQGDESGASLETQKNYKMIFDHIISSNLLENTHGIGA